MIKIIVNILVIAFFSLPFNCLSQESSDHLRPCADGLMGFHSLDEYNSYLKKYFFKEKNVEDPGNFIRILAMPSFENEKYLSIYQDGEAFYISYLVPNEAIWVALANARQGERDPNILDIDEIQVSQKLIMVSKELFDATISVMWKMVMNAKYPPGNRFTILDGSNYIFSTSLGVCTMTTNQSGPKLETLIDLTHKLIDYANQNESSIEVENEIIKFTEKLLL